MREKTIDIERKFIRQMGEDYFGNSLIDLRMASRLGRKLKVGAYRTLGREPPEVGEHRSGCKRKDCSVSKEYSGTTEAVSINMTNL